MKLTDVDTPKRYKNQRRKRSSYKTIPKIEGYSRKDIIAFVKTKLKTDLRWACVGLLTLFDEQTTAEQNNHISDGHNGIGFNRWDAPILSRLITKIKKSLISNSRKFTANNFPFDKLLTKREQDTIKKKVWHYAVQLINKSDIEKLKVQLDYYYREENQPELPWNE